MDSSNYFAFFPALLLVAVLAVLIRAKIKRDARGPLENPPSRRFVPTPEYKGPFAFLRRHYNGDYTLARSYWVNFLLASLFAPLVGILLLPWFALNLPARYGSAGVLFITGLGILIWLWAASGTWASSDKHVGRGGSAVWAGAAKIMIGLSVLSMIGEVIRKMPMLHEHFRVAMGAQFGADATFELRSDGRSILLSGGINDGSAEQLDKALQMAPSVTTVVLSSNGGWIREGKLLADVIRKHDLNTYVEDNCASACTIAFLAGRERAAAPLATIGFHASRGVGGPATESNPADSDSLRGLYRAAGVLDSFVSQALDTPNEKMWRPTHEDMLQAHVLTRTSMGGETAALSTVVRSKEALAENLKITTMYAILAKRFPNEFDALVEATWATMKQGAIDADVIAAARSHIMAMLPRFLVLASDESLVAYVALIQEELEALRGRNAMACAESMFPTGKSMIVYGNLPEELAKRDLALIATVLEEADPAFGIKPSDDELESVAMSAVKGMTQEQRMLFVDESVRLKSTPEEICDAAVNFFEGLSAIPVADRGRALRVLYAATAM